MSLGTRGDFPELDGLVFAGTDEEGAISIDCDAGNWAFMTGERS